MRCLIVDDEPLAQNVLEKYISRIEGWEIVAKIDNAIDAQNLLRKENIDVLFLDIQMPEMTGMELLRTLKNPPKIVLTTAYSEHALESYQYGVTDYLMKPISFERFSLAVDKILGEKKSSETPTQETKSNDFVFLKSDKKLYKVFYHDIFYLEGCGNYVKVYTKEKMIMVLEKLSELESMLPSDTFLRVHKSFIVSIPQIKLIEGNSIQINTQHIPVGESYKAAFEAIVAKFKI